jgi:hypothetical protein
VSALGDYDNGEIGGMIGRGYRSTQRKPAPVPLCPPLEECVASFFTVQETNLRMEAADSSKTLVPIYETI